MPQDAETMSEQELIERGRQAVETRERQDWRRLGMRRLLDDKMLDDPSFDVYAYGKEYQEQGKGGTLSDDEPGDRRTETGVDRRHGEKTTGRRDRDDDTKVTITDDSDD